MGNKFARENVLQYNDFCILQEIKGEVFSESEQQGKGLEWGRLETALAESKRASWPKKYNWIAGSTEYPDE